jgi:hypothetical protein
MGGRSFGKWALGLRVTTSSGGRPGPAALLVRNCVRSVDLLVGVPLMLLDPLARRLGDRLAGTLVLHSQAAGNQPVIAARAPLGWQSGQLAVLEGFLQRADELEPARAERLAGRLLAAIERDDPELFAEAEPRLPPVERLRVLVKVEAR